MRHVSHLIGPNDTYQQQHQQNGLKLCKIQLSEQRVICYMAAMFAQSPFVYLNDLQFTHN